MKDKQLRALKKRIEDDPLYKKIVSSVSDMLRGFRDSSVRRNMKTGHTLEENKNELRRLRNTLEVLSQMMCKIYFKDDKKAFEKLFESVRKENSIVNDDGTVKGKLFITPYNFSEKEMKELESALV